MVRAYLAFDDIYALRRYVKANPEFTYHSGRFDGARYILIFSAGDA